jgi:hypothetical protein
MADDATYEVGDIANGHVWTGSEWVTAIEGASADAESFAVGSVVNEHAWTGSDWVPVRRLGAPAPKQGFRERWEEAQRMGEAWRLEEEEKRAAKLADDPMYVQYGRCVAEGAVAGRRVKIYEKGYVQVGVLKLGAPERLLGITATDMSSQKTAIGRGIVAVATMGTNLMVTPNKRGSYYLVIVTDRKTHNLTLSPPTNSDLRDMHKLEAAGKAVLAGLAAEAAIPATPVVENPVVPASDVDLAAQLTQLAQLHGSGALTDDEFAAAKQRLLGQT